ncbi:Eco57I restriction-modification methylase domain-containing protein, partial [Hyphomicrobium sp.]|uniref:Eco57I restriction-modification methylase domain-containing protein n=1 Tax=Hyphomicrobium sp. TaxID=82 RepID=UPI003D09C5AA
IYRAATRVVMRMVVVLFAEARDDLLPRSNPVYHLSYGLQGLREALQQAGAGTRDGLARLAHRHAAWPRVLALFRLVFRGSPHKDLPLIRYGGGLFEPGDPASDDPLRRALAALEDPARGPHDADVYRMLDLLCVTEMRLRQGAGWKRVNVPVDFSDLSSEYIGILYEGLLDYELRRADPGDPIVFLALGDQPALPLSRLEGMTDEALAELVGKLKVKAKPAGDEEGEDDEGDGEEEDDADADAAPADPGAEDDVDVDAAEASADAAAALDDARQAAVDRAHAWACRAVEAGRLVRKPKSKKDALDQHAAAIAEAARSLIARTVLPGEWFLVRWGGTRKGAGTFYTPKELAVPTVWRTLEPLCYEEARGARREAREAAGAAEEAGDGGDQELQGSARLAAGDGLDGCDLSDDRALSGEGALRADAADAPGSGFDPIEHRRGIRPAIDGRIPPPSEDRPRLSGRAGDTASAGAPPANGSRNEPGGAAPTSGRVLADAGGPHIKDRLSLAPHASCLAPRPPEEILALKVCDPAMGSASFLVAGLRFLTDALYRSLHHHGRIAAQGEHTLVTLAEGKPSRGSLAEETLPCRPDAEDFEPRLRAVLKRYIVERCLYGVDLDPLAVELGRLALWIETLDRDLPFEFLDHKLKVGNALVGCWFDRFRDYPVLAWDREGGDSTHANGVHFPKDGWTKAIKSVRNGAVKRELIELISRQMTFDDHVAGRTPEALHDEAAAALEMMHGMRVADGDKRAAFYREHLGSGSVMQELRVAFDAWCALWFWPADRIDLAPTPRRLHALTDQQRAVVAELWRDLRFFHWELEFPDVFCRERETRSGGDAPAHAGFDAIVGNPPWEIQKPNSKEFFSNLDPLYRTYGKQEALRCQQAIFEGADADERAWLEYCARLKALSNWNRSAASPFGDGAADGVDFSFGRGGDALHARWRAIRGGHRGYADPCHPFRHQGSADINTYKMFLEQAHALLREDGQLGIVVPSGLYTDKGSTDLRHLFLERCRWQWLFGFENKLRIFDIHRSFKFCPVIVRKGGATEAIRAAFMRHDLADWTEAERHVIPYGREQVARFSPRTRAILEIRQKRDLEVLEKIYANSVLLGDDSENGWGIEYTREFDMTNDSKLFPPRPWWEERGYVPDEYGRWIKFKGRPNPNQTTPAIGWIRLRDGGGAVNESDIEDIALPLYEGRMIGQFDFSQKGWVSGKGRKAVWREIPWEQKQLEPQYLIAKEDLCASPKANQDPKIAYMRISSSTNSRTTISTYLRSFPAGDSVFFFRSVAASESDCLFLATVLSTFAFDYQARMRLGGLNMSEFVMVETALPGPDDAVGVQAILNDVAGQLSLAHISFASEHLLMCSDDRVRGTKAWRHRWALTRSERMRLRAIIDASVAALYGFGWDDVSWLLRACDRPVAGEGDSDPKGFWRVDKEHPPELRHPVLALIAFHHLQDTIRVCDGDRDRAIAAFCGTLDPALVPDLPFLDPTSGWQLPETLRLADYGLGHDERAKTPQPVRARLGERFLPWQLAQSPEDSWRECEIHARNILGETGFAKLQAEIGGQRSEDPAEDRMTAAVAEPAAQYGLFDGSSQQNSAHGRRRRG